MEMEKAFARRMVSRLGAIWLALLLVVTLCAPVWADEAGQATQEPSSVYEDTDSFAAVEAQLAAVARAKGRAIAEQMLFESFRALSPVAPVEAEATAAPENQASGAPSVVVHAERKVTWSFSGLLPFLVVLGAAAVMLLALSVRRSQTASAPRSYRPMSDRTFRDQTLEKRDLLHLD